jgi:glycolate oxidase iron-sulfur subunit
MGVFERIKLRQFTKNIARLGSDAIYFPGCTTQKYLPEVAANYRSILGDLGVSVRTIEPFCCGRPLKEQGYVKEFEEHKAKTKAMLEEQGVQSVVTNCAACMHTLRDDYGLEVRHTTDIIWEQRKKLQAFNNGEVTFQDNCIGARKLGLHGQARDILIQTGFRVKEFDECKAGVRCCGGSCGLMNNGPTVAVKLAQRRIRDAPANTIVTDDPNCYIQLKRNTQNKEVLELSETLVEI